MAQGAWDWSRLDVPVVGRVERYDGSPGVRVLDAAGEVIGPVDEFLATLSASDSPSTTLYAYASALLRWWRFLALIEVGWDRATSANVRDYVLWMRSTKRGPSSVGYAPATINHNLAVLLSFYDERLDAGVGPVINPVPVTVEREGPRRRGARSTMEPFRQRKRAPLRQKQPMVRARGLSDQAFDELFTSMSSNRDRALLAFYVSTAVRASELLGLTVDRVDVANLMIEVRRKGTGRLQRLPASSDAFVWWRLYESQITRPPGETAVWLTRRSPVVALSYPAMRRVIQRANARLGTGWTLHDLRHTAARRMIKDPSVSLTDVQWVLGHAHLSTTELYLRPDDDDVIERVIAHHRSAAEQPPAEDYVGDGYRPGVLETLLGAAARGR
jgi:site-specific recombinase XerD